MKMVEQNTAISISSGGLRSCEEPKKASRAFGYTFVFLVAAIGLAGAYESLAQKYWPARSLLAGLHSYGYMRSYAVAYEPSKGIWLLLGWIGSSLMAVMMLYSLRKRVALFKSLGAMRHWLNLHMLMGVLGPLLITLHTTFKFNGLIATSYWCMMVTTVFGILGRYIYVQIPRGITGTELKVKEIEKEVEKLDKGLGRYLVRAHMSNLLYELGVRDASRLITNAERGPGLPESFHLSKLLDEIEAAEIQEEKNPALALLHMAGTDIRNFFRLRRIRKVLRQRYRLEGARREEVFSALKEKAVLMRRKNLLSTSQRLLHHWHVLHVPLAIVMFLIMFLHVLIYYLFRPGI